jgi:hypothetical protein
VGYLLGLTMTIKYTSCGFLNATTSLNLFIGFFIGSSLVLIEYLQSIETWKDHYVGPGTGNIKTSFIFFVFPSNFNKHLLDSTAPYTNSWTFAFY